MCHGSSIEGAATPEHSPILRSLHHFVTTKLLKKQAKIPQEENSSAKCQKEGAE